MATNPAMPPNTTRPEMYEPVPVSYTQSDGTVLPGVMCRWMAEGIVRHGYEFISAKARKENGWPKYGGSGGGRNA